MLPSTQENYDSSKRKSISMDILLQRKDYSLLKDIKVPENAAELLTILGMINYLNRFSVKLADCTVTLRELTKKHVPRFSILRSTGIKENK